MSNQAGREAAAHSHASAVFTSGLEFAESSSVTLEWRLSGLKEIYESTKGEAKSKCLRSAIFGDADNLWEILFYPNSGSNNGEFSSLYLSAVREKDQAINKRWVRKGLWWFKLEVKTCPDPASGKSVIISTKDASDHTFALKTANWGWQSFAKRDHLFTTQPLCIALDTLIITCTLQAQPQPPAGFWLGLNRELPSYRDGTSSGGGLSAWAGGDGASGRAAGGSAAAAEPMTIVPASLLTSIASMINYDDYCDVEFVLPAPAYIDSDDETTEPVATRPPRKILATETMLERIEYFNVMLTWDEEDNEEKSASELPDLDETICDSDQEEERKRPRRNKKRSSANVATVAELPHPVDGFPKTASVTSLPDVHDMAHAQSLGGDRSYNSESEGDAKSALNSEDAQMSDAEAKTKPGRSSAGEDVSMDAEKGKPNGPSKRKVVITDSALSTWYAIIYWIYTDRIVFAPLSSTFNSGPVVLLNDAKLKSSKSGSSTPSHQAEYKTRREWIDAWLKERQSVELDASRVDHRLRPRNGLVPVSAKAVYRLADKMDIEPLKLRAYQHIMANLTVDNCPFELFSMFSSIYASIRKVQMAFFLKNWGEIRKSDALKQIWTQIRLGRHVGFEEVWPLIVGQLEFKPAA